MEVPECNVCHAALDEDEHQPRHLGCSHDACTACVKSLIKNDSLECPMCRTVMKAFSHEDFLINHGVCQVLRLFKGLNVMEKKQKEEGATANVREVCRIHECTADKRCASCKLWICVYCIELHTADVGCEIQEHSEFLKNEKKKHLEEVKPTLLSVRYNLRLLSSELSYTESEKKKIVEKIEHLQRAIQDGRRTLNKFVTATETAIEACTTMELNESVNISKDWHQFAQIWCKKNSHQLEVMKKQSFPRPTFVFIEMSLDDMPKGRITIHLNDDLPNIKEYMVNIVTNRFGKSLSGIETYCHRYAFCLSAVPLRQLEGIATVNPDSEMTTVAKRGDVCGNFECGYLNGLFFTLVPHTYASANVFGTIVDGLDILDKWYDSDQGILQFKVSIIACGLV